MILKASLYTAIALIASFNAQASSPDQAAGKSPDRVCATATATTDPGNFTYCAARTLWLQGNYADAEPKLTRAAKIGSKPAQYLLGIAYFNGDGLAADRPRGLAWLALSSDAGDRADYLGTFKSAYEQTSDDEHARAEKILERLQKPERSSIARSRVASSVLRCGQTPADVQLIACGGPITLSPQFSERMGPAPAVAISNQSSRGR